MSARIRWYGLALALGAIACNGQGTGPSIVADPRLDRDVALTAGDGAAQDLVLMGASGGNFGPGLAPPAAAVAGPFGCGTIEMEHLIVSRTCTFKDANGATQQSYDPKTTASIAIHFHLAGEITRDDWTAEVDRTRDLVVSGLLGVETTRTWNGTGNGTATRTKHSDGEQRQYDITSTLTVTNVVVEIPRITNPWPLSGTISKHLVIKVIGGPNDGKTFDRTVTITFNGTQLVPIQVNGKTFTFDLKTRKIVSNG